MGRPSLLVALDYLELLAEVKPDRLERAAVRWHSRLEVEAVAMTRVESQLALAALPSPADCWSLPRFVFMNGRT